MRQGRFITTAVAAMAAMAIGPAGAVAAPSPLTDGTIGDFTEAGAQTGTWVVEPGQVRLKGAAVAENFDTLPTGWATPWATGQTAPNVGGNATATGGVLTVDGAHVNDTNLAPTFAAPQTLEFRATFTDPGTNHTEEFQNIGFGNTFNEPLWAAFGTGPAVGGTFFARTLGGATPTDTPLSVDPKLPHVYRIEWGADIVKFYVDDAPVATHTTTIASPMRPVVSDLNRLGDGGPTVKVDWLSLSAPTSGTFTSRVLAADSSHTVWANLTSASSGTAFETRTGNTATPDASWSAFQAVGAGGAIQSPSGQHIQYRATLAGSAASLNSASIAYTVDTTAPSAAVNSVDVSGTTASVSFSSPDGDIAGFQCNLDSGAFAPCTSPTALTGLAAGSHTVAVRGVDKAGNVGDAGSMTFSIASSGGTGQPSGGSNSADKTAPKVSLVAKSLRASRKGTVSFRVGCPATETSCKVTLKLKNAGKTAASKTLTIKGGKTVTVTLTLNKATRQLLKHGSVKVSAVVTATDAAGNRKTTTKRMTLRRAAA